MPRKIIVVQRARKMRLKSRSILQVFIPRRGGGEPQIREVPIRDIEALIVIGRNNYIESSVLSVLAQHNIPTAVIAKDSTAILYNPIITISNNARRAQYEAPKQFKLAIAAHYIWARLKGMAGIIEYYTGYKPPVPPPPIPKGRNIQEIDPQTLEYEIRTWEAGSSATLWKQIIQLIPEETRRRLERQGLTGRKPRSPDPFNKTITIAYAILYSLSTKALLAAGLDPTHGLLHRTHYNTPLSFDYSEMLKPTAIHTALTLARTNNLPETSPEGELLEGQTTKIIGTLYRILQQRHRKTNKTIHYYIYTKAQHLSKTLQTRKINPNKLTITYNKKNFQIT